MNGPIRVPMPRPAAAVFAKDDVATSVEPMKVGRRFTLDVDEQALATMGRQAMPFIVEKLAENAIHSHGHTIDAAVHAMLYDKDKRDWLEGIVEDETRKVVQSFMRDTLAVWVEKMEVNAIFWRELALRYGPTPTAAATAEGE